MAGYQRFVAYVYEYRKGKKDGSSGYVRVEARDRKCRIEVHLRCVGLEPGSRCCVYGFVRREGLMDGILIGSCMTGRERIECMLETDTEDIGGMGKNLQELGGMLLISDAGGFWGTEWDDKPIRPENFREWKKEEKSDGDENQDPGMTAEPQKKQNAEIGTKEEQIKQEKIEESQPKEGQSAQKNPPKEKEQVQMQDATGEGKKEAVQEQPQEKIQQKAEDMRHISKSQTMTAEEFRESERVYDSAPGQPEEFKQLQKAHFEDRETPDNPNPGIKHSEKRPQESPPKHPKPPRPHPGTPCDPFRDGQFTDCRRIKPSDCNLLCRKNGCFCSNRFVMYGYQNFGHLLLCRNHQGQYILGVPGSYSQQERFMANMFGFPYFKESSDIQISGGKGGYWYCLINV